MKVALIAPPFISVPPADYGGTELFVAHLAEGLQKSGMEVVVYTNGESTVDVERRLIFDRSQAAEPPPPRAAIGARMESTESLVQVQ